MFASKDLFFTKPSGGYQISRSVRFRSSATAYFNRTVASTTYTYTLSLWVKRGKIGVEQILTTSRSSGAGNTSYFEFNASDQLVFLSDAVTIFTTTAVYRDPSAWYHIVLKVTQSGAVVCYVNNQQVATGTASATSFLWNSGGTYTNVFGVYGQLLTAPFDGYMTEINYIDGQAMTPSSFGETNAVTGVWQPKKYTGTYGTNGFYLNFSDNSSNTATTIGKDYSGNGNNWTPNNISVTAGATYDSMLDSPTVSASSSNYAVMNPLTSQGNTVSDGNLKVTLAASSAAGYGTRGSIAISSGNKFYWEISPTTTTSVYTVIGIIDAAYKFGTDIATAGSNCVLYYKSSGNKIVNGTTTSYGTTYAANDVIGVAVDYSANTCTFYLNNVSQGAISLPSTSIDYIPVVANENLVADVFQANFGQRPFTYTPPTGFVALNTQNLPTPTISNGANYMAATLYTGNGTTTNLVNSVNGVSFKPDLVWQKNRSSAANNILVDSVRGGSLYLISNTTGADASAPGYMTFNSNGESFTSSDITTNQSGQSYVAWQWQAGAGSTVSNTSGSITSTVSAGATQGFSVVTYTGTGANATVGHGLGVAPSFIIAKWRTGGTTQGWTCYHTSLGASQYLVLNSTAAAATNTPTWVTTPTSSVFSVSTDNWNNGSGWTFVAYCFAAVAGYSAFGSYTGNGSTDGTFVYCGFRPRWIMIKRTDLVANWTIIDTSMSPYNVTDAGLLANSSGAQSTGAGVGAGYDILSNGFKARLVVANEENVNGATMIYAAFAENPFKYSLAR